MMHIGIDGGPGGGIVALSPVAGLPPVWMEPMPTLKRDGERLVDGRRLVTMLRELPWPADGLAVYIEDLPRHSMSKAAMRSMALNFGRMVGALEARLQCDRVIISTVPAGNSLKGWQKAMLGKCPKGGTKARALEVAQAIWPGQNWTPEGCRTPNDGLIDAALIAEHGRRLAEARRAA